MNGRSPERTEQFYNVQIPRTPSFSSKKTYDIIIFMGVNRIQVKL